MDKDVSNAIFYRLLAAGFSGEQLMAAHDRLTTALQMEIDLHTMRAMLDQFVKHEEKAA